MTRKASVFTCLLLSLAAPRLAPAQSLGTFRWQLQPYCNVVTVAITQSGALYRLEGTDDQCGAGRDLASVQGLAFPNPDGTIGFGLTIVTAPGGAPVHVDAEIALATLGGTWRDSTGNSGTFTFTPGGVTGGTPRPPAPAAIPSAFLLAPNGNLLATGMPDVGTAPASGSGVRMMWYPGKAAFRAGRVDGPYWDDASVGPTSTAFGFSTTASGPHSTAMGTLTKAAGYASTAMGEGTSAIGPVSMAMGRRTTAEGLGSTSTGIANSAAGDASLAGGERTTATGDWAFAFGFENTAGGDHSVALGRSAFTIPTASGSFVFADNSTIVPFGSLGPNGFNVRASGGFQFYTNPAATLGAVLPPNATQWSVLSDARMKEAFRALEPEDVLARIAAMPVQEWNYIAQGPSIRHIGPTAQDFHAAFGLGEDPLRIGTLDADGVALASVRALEARTRALPERAATLEAENAGLRAEIAIIRERLEQLERLLSTPVTPAAAARGGR